MLEAEEIHGEWIIDREHKGTPDDPKQFPFVGYGRVACDLIDMVHQCVDDNEDLDVRDYRGALDGYGLPETSRRGAAPSRPSPSQASSPPCANGN